MQLWSWVEDGFYEKLFKNTEFRRQKKGERKGGQEHFSFGNFGLPRGRRVDSKFNWLTARIIQTSEPYGRPRRMQLANFSKSVSFGNKSTNPNQLSGNFIGPTESVSPSLSLPCRTAKLLHSHSRDLKHGRQHCPNFYVFYVA